MEIIDGFLANPQLYREKALRGTFQDLVAFDGEKYDRIQPYYSEEVRIKLEAIFGPVLVLGSGFRLNFNSELPNNPVHVDVGWGTHALVTYLSESQEPKETGTAFWSQDKQTMVYLCQEKFNRCVIYRSDQPHSRWPFEAYGDNPENGRLIFVAFFSPLNELEG